MIRLSVVLPAYFPPPEQIDPTLAALRAQTLPATDWELVIVDNRTEPPLAATLATWHPHGRVIREEKAGLTHARLAGVTATTADVVLFVDQDNVLAPDFLANVLRIAAEHPHLGTWGAAVITPRYENPDLAPPASLQSLLTLRSASRDEWSNDPDHHASTPWGAGLCARRAVLEAYAAAVAADAQRSSLDLCGGRRLASGDTDISHIACELGFGKGIFTALRLDHIIPAGRCTAAYLCKYAEDRGYSDILHHLIVHRRLPVMRTGLQERLRVWWHGRALTPLERLVRLATLRGRERALQELAASPRP